MCIVPHELVSESVYLNMFKITASIESIDDAVLTYEVITIS